MKHTEIIDLGIGIEIHYYLDANDTAQQFTMFKCVVHPDAKVPAPHYHDTFDETFYVLTGSATVTLDGKTINMKPGEHAFIPKGTVHGFHNTTTEIVEILCYATPGVFTADYFKDLRDILTAGGPPDMKKVKEIMLNHGLVPVAG